MIAATPGFIAVYDLAVREVIAWADDGSPMVLGKSSLVDARSLPGFDRLRFEEDRIVAAIPGGGFIGRWKDDEGSSGSQPLVAWALTAGGRLVPIETCGDGACDELIGTVEHPQAELSSPPAP